MEILIPYVHYGTITIAIILPILGASIGQALIGTESCNAIDRQPSARPEILRTSIIGMALAETSGIIGFGFALILFILQSAEALTWYSAIAEIGCAFAIGLPGLAIGILSAYPAREAVAAVARQPFSAQQINNIMLLTLSIGQTGILFGLIIGLFIMNGLSNVTMLADSLRLLTSGMAIGIGCLGPTWGLNNFARAACRNLGYRPGSYSKILPFTIISEAIIETPMLFALIIALILARLPIKSDSILEGIILLAAGLTIALGTCFPGINSSKVAAEACDQISQHPEQYSVIARVSLLAQTFIDTSALYALLVSILLILLRP